ncbi:ribonuclease H-like domain-containing protein [Tanacetum coccineum]|uniref:Ribonuclease H-like domain-containing protein n=1 Tax=Tanacetum coccineum TaxID=301880 RepID=A0ABQ5I539_9ASTR
MAGSEDDIPPPPPPSQTPTKQTPHTISTIKLRILKKGEYDIWAMKMEHYLAHTTIISVELIKEKWSLIKEDAEYILSISLKASLLQTQKGYIRHDRFQKSSESTKINGAGVSTKMQIQILGLYLLPGLNFLNHKEPTKWTVSVFDDLYNNLRVFEFEFISGLRHRVGQVPINAARKVNTVKPIVNNARPKAGFHKSVSPFRKSFNRTTALRTNFSKQKVNTTEVNAVRLSTKRFTEQRIVDSRCSRHLTETSLPLLNIEDFNGALCFWSSKRTQHLQSLSVPRYGDKKEQGFFSTLTLNPYSFAYGFYIGPTSARSLNQKTYAGYHDDFSKVELEVFFLRTKDETRGILKDFIRQIENQLNQKVKSIRCDNGTEFKNRDFIKFYGSKGIKREYSNARTP